MALAVARWDANTCAASPFLHTSLRPLLKSYISFKQQGLKFWFGIEKIK